MNLLYEIIVIYKLIVFEFELIFPYWIFGLLAGSVVSVFASGKINSLISRLDWDRHMLSGSAAAALLGAASPICMYGTVPLIAALGKKGIPQYLLTAFMISSILINPNLFIFSFALGVPLALIRLSMCILAGITAGLLVRFIFRNRNVFDYSGFEGKSRENSHKSIFIRLISDIHRAVIKTAPYFLAGILLAALFERYVPKSLVINLFGSNKGFGVLLAASLGVPVYVCGGGTIPLLKAWMNAGMSEGSAIAFMLSGAATKLTNLSAVKIILGIRNFVLYIVFNIVFAVAAGLLTDLFY